MIISKRVKEINLNYYKDLGRWHTALQNSMLKDFQKVAGPSRRDGISKQP
jgi:hypothetical protein